VLDSITDVVERRLKLVVNREKSSVRHAREARLWGWVLLLPLRGGYSG
jgi:hypothetical protein